MKFRFLTISASLIWFAGVAPPIAVLASGLDDYNNGLREAHAGNFDAAIDFFDQAIESSELDRDQQATAYFDRGLIQGRLGNRDAAISDYRDAVTLNPRHVKALSSLCYELIRAAQLDLALHNCNKAIEIKPDNAPSYSIRAEIWKKKERHDRSESDYNRAIELNPDNWMLYYNLGTFYENTGRDADARNSFLQSFNRAPDWGKHQHPSTSKTFREYGFR